METQEVIDYLAGLKDNDRLVIYTRVNRKLDELRREKFQQTRLKYLKKKKSMLARGEDFKKVLKVGDVIKVTGARDTNNPFREIISLNETKLFCIKLKYDRKNDVFRRQSYLTDHGYEKVLSIIHSTETGNPIRIIGMYDKC